MKNLHQKPLSREKELSDEGHNKERSHISVMNAQISPLVDNISNRWCSRHSFSRSQWMIPQSAKIESSSSNSLTCSRCFSKNGPPSATPGTAGAHRQSLHPAANQKRLSQHRFFDPLPPRNSTFISEGREMAISISFLLTKGNNMFI